MRSTCLTRAIAKSLKLLTNKPDLSKTSALLAQHMSRLLIRWKALKQHEVLDKLFHGIKLFCHDPISNEDYPAALETKILC